MCIRDSGEIFGVEVTDKDDVIKYAKKLQEQGARNVLVSMAGDGAVLVTEAVSYTHLLRMTVSFHRYQVSC